MKMRLLEDNLFRIKRHLWFSNYRRVLSRHRRILHDYCTVFIHIPKTAGNSIAGALNALPKKTDQEVPNISKHATAAQVKRLLGDRLWQEYFTFTCVRNPWDLMVSSYSWWLQTAPKHKKIMDPDVRAVRRLGSFSAFVKSPFGRTMINEYTGDMFDWYSENGEVIVDFIARLENLQEDWKEICRSMGIAYNRLPHVNRTERTAYSEYYNDETRQIVAERFHKTIELFGYEF
jgi:hypothetical protein